MYYLLIKKSGGNKHLFHVSTCYLLMSVYSSIRDLSKRNIKFNMVEIELLIPELLKSISPLLNTWLLKAKKLLTITLDFSL